jgi:uncharacterized protein
MNAKNIAGPLVRGSDFWGRDVDRAALWDLLDKGDLLLNAPRRYGKSSLMCSLFDQPKDDWVVVMLDVENVETPAEFLTELSAALSQTSAIRRLWETAKRAPGTFLAWITSGVDGIEIGAENIGQAKLNLRKSLVSDNWPELTEQLFAELARHEQNLLLIIDEFPWMITNFLDKDEARATHFLKWFRALRQKTRKTRVRALLGGSVNLEPRLEQIGREALINDLQRYRLRPLSIADSVTFVREILQGEGIPFEAEAPAEIVRVIDCGVHFFLQVLVSECLADVRHHARGRLTCDVIESVYAERVLGPSNRSRFSHYHTRLKQHYGPLERAARIVLARLTERSPESHETLAAMLRAAGEDVSVERVVALLESDYYITRELDEVAFSSGFLRDWWRRNAPVPVGVR